MEVEVVVTRYGNGSAFVVEDFWASQVAVRTSCSMFDPWVHRERGQVGF